MGHESHEKTGKAKFGISDMSGPISGVLEFDGNRLYFTETGGARRVISLASNVVTADVVVSNTAVKTAIYTIPLQADEGLAGKVYRVNSFGTLRTTNAPQNLDIIFDIDGTTITFSLTGVQFNVSPYATWHGFFDIIIRTVGETGTFAANTHMEITGPLSDDHQHQIDTGTINTSQQNDLVISVDWGTAHIDNVFTLVGGFVEDLN